MKRIIWLLALLLLIPTLYAKPKEDNTKNRVTELESQVAALQVQVVDLLARMNAAEPAIATNTGDIATNASAIAAIPARYTDAEAVAAVGPHYTDAEAIAAVGPHTPAPTTTDLEALGFVTGPHTDAVDISGLEDAIAYYDDLLYDVIRTEVPDPQDGSILYDTLVFEGMNVQIVNGSGNTNGTPDGVGNLIVGYNESRGGFECPDGLGCDRRTGSHNLIVGHLNNYTSYGGMVAGQFNEINGVFSSVSGGFLNTASGQSSSVSGGGRNTASGESSSVSGGAVNAASGIYSSVSGGESNTASVQSSSVSGGLSREAAGLYDWRAGTLFEEN